MKRKAFTLVEILLCIAIVAILATILARVISGVMPDVNKAKFLRVYNASKMIVADMVNDTSIYPDDDPSSSLYGFGNTAVPIGGIYGSSVSGSVFSGNYKFARIFADKLGISNAASVTNSFYSTRDNVTYNITKSGNGYKIIYKIKDPENPNASIELGYMKVEQDGEVSCYSSLNYCDDMTNLRRGG